MPRQYIKTATYSVMHVCVAVTVAYMLIGQLAAALAIGLIEPLVQTFAYHFHEAAWARQKDNMTGSAKGSPEAAFA